MARKRRKKMELSEEEIARRSENMKKVQASRAEQQAEEKMISEGGVVDSDLTARERLFLEKYVWGGVMYTADHAKSYHSAFGGQKKHSARNGRAMLKKKHIALMLTKMLEEYDELMSEDKNKNREVLRSIRDEMAGKEQINRFNEEINVAANRNTAINAVKVLNEQDGNNKPKEVNLNTEKVSFVMQVVQPPKEEIDEE